MNNEKYSDIINLPHPDPRTRPRMSLSDRAAQFAPFAALTGYDDAITEEGRLTSSKIELDENELERLDRALTYLTEHRSQRPSVTVTYFVPDEKKSGGAYISREGAFKAVDRDRRLILLTDGSAIPIPDVLTLESEILPHDI